MFAACTAFIGRNKSQYRFSKVVIFHTVFYLICLFVYSPDFAQHGYCADKQSAERLSDCYGLSIGTMYGVEL